MGEATLSQSLPRNSLRIKQIEFSKPHFSTDEKASPTREDTSISVFSKQIYKHQMYLVKKCSDYDASARM